VNVNVRELFFSKYLSVAEGTAAAFRIFNVDMNL